MANYDENTQVNKKLFHAISNDLLKVSSWRRYAIRARVGALVRQVCLV